MKSSIPFTSSPIATMPPAEISSGASPSCRLAVPFSSASPQTSFAFSGWKRNGSQPSAYSAAPSTDFGPSAAMKSGTALRSGLLRSLSALPSPVPWPSGKGSL